MDAIVELVPDRLIHVGARDGVYLYVFPHTDDYTL